MAIATYATDLLTVNLAEATTNWVEMTGRTSGGAVDLEDRAHLQGSYAISQSTGVATARTVGLQVDYLSNISWTSGFVFLMWQYWQAPKAIGIWADGGMRIGVGSTAGNVKLWNAQGNDYGRNPYGGWSNTAVDPTYAYDELIGAPVDGAYRIFCSAPYLLLAVSKGNPHCVDAIRYGRGLLKIEYGESGAYGTFAGMATANDADLARWGLFSLQMGTYLWKGLMSIGTDTNAVNFIDSNRSIIVDDCPRTYLAFNRIEIRNASSVVTLSNISFKNLGTLSPGQLEVIANATISMDGCSFQDMNTFIFQSNCSITNTTFKSCALITSGGGIYTGSKVLTSTVAADASALGWNSATNPDGKLDNMTFSKGTNAHHAIDFGTSASTTITLRGITFTGFNALNEQNDSVLYISNITDTITIQCIGCTGTVTYKRAGSNTVNLTQGVLTKVTVKTSATPPVAINGARVLVLAASGGPMPYNIIVTISNLATTATVTHTAHGMATNDKVQIKGASLWQNNGVFTITVSNVDTYTYTLPEAPGSSPTGTILATFAALFNTSDSNGEVSMTRVFTSSQPINGRVRMSTSAPYYKTSNFIGTISSTAGFLITIQMIEDT